MASNDFVSETEALLDEMERQMPAEVATQIDLREWVLRLARIAVGQRRRMQALEAQLAELKAERDPREAWKLHF
jgi:hypothetical protein